MTYYLLFFELQIKRYELNKILLKSDSNPNSNFVLNKDRPRGGLW
jgi:hypothetical protein